MVNMKNIIISLLLVVCFGPLNAVHSFEHASIQIYQNEAEDDLELNQETSLNIVWEQFLAKGGTLIRLEGNVKPFQLQVGDVVFPSCSGGQNRSQTLWAVLRPYSDKLVLMPPHATRYGFDPYNGLINWKRKEHGYKYDEFKKWSGFAKSTKFGWDLFADQLSRTELTTEEFNMLRSYYDKAYYNPENMSGMRRIYITFAKNAHVHLYRLVQTNDSLENVIVLFYPLEDLIAHPLPEWNTHRSSVKAYTELSNLIKLRLDLSLLK